MTDSSDSFGAWAITAMVVVVAAVLVGMAMFGIIKEERRLEDYRRDVHICATTADDQSEFRACVKAADR